MRSNSPEIIKSPKILVLSSMVSACLCLSLSLVLTGCAPPVMSTDSQSVGMFPVSAKAHAGTGTTEYQSQELQHQVKTRVITEYVPVPVPGQLMPAPTQDKAQATIQNNSAGTAENAENGEKAVALANKNAVLTPDSNSFFNAISSYDYMPGSLYTVYTAPMRITDITLAPGEKIISNAAGDTLRWQVSQTYSGQGDQVSQHILVKPDLPNLDNTMVINTDQHVYHLVLKSTNNDTYMVAVSWRYPGDMVQSGQDIPGAQSGSDLDQASQSNLSHSRSGSSSEHYGLDLNNLDFNYQFGMVKGAKPDWYPVRVFSDGRQTFIQFPANFFNSATPVLYIADNNGLYGTMVNWRLKGPYMIVDAVIQKARLQIGIDKTGQTIVQIQHSSPALGSALNNSGANTASSTALN